jgi:starch phosphorylase
MEFLIGRLLSNNILSLGVMDATRQACARLGLDFSALCGEEPDAGLGNGGLGRLAACYLDSLATLEYPGYGYGIRYEHGMFRQEFSNGWQTERPELLAALRQSVGDGAARIHASVLVFGQVEPMRKPVERRTEFGRIGRCSQGVPYDHPGHRLRGQTT